MAGTTRPLPPGLLPSDEWLIQMLLEGRVDADIGGELGLSAGEVRERVSLLASKLDVNGRDGIRRYCGVDRGIQGDESQEHGSRRAGLRWPRRHAVVWVAGAVALAAIGAVSALALTQGSGDSQAAAHATASSQASASATVAARIAAENPGGWYDAGPLFFVDDTTQPVVSSSVRALYTAVTLAGPGLIKLDAGNVKWSGSNNFGGSQQATLTGMVKGVWESVTVRADDSTRLLVDAQGIIRFFGVNGSSKPVLMLSAQPFGANPVHKASIGADGRFFLDPKPVPVDAPVNSNTGEQLDLSQAMPLSVNYAASGAFTSCGGDVSHEDGGQCAVYWAALVPLLAPADGTLHCSASRDWELDTPSFVLSFAGHTATPTGQTPVACDLSESKEVRAGIDEVGEVGTRFVITATTTYPTLAPLSVAIGGSTMYVGPIHLTVGCPCMGGS